MRVIKEIVRTMVLVSALVACAFVVSAANNWMEPTGEPPSGNPDFPINVGSVFQARAGGLEIQHGLILNSGNAVNPSVNGLIVANGNVGIDTVNPTKALDVAGDVHASGDVCIDKAGGGQTCLKALGTPGSGVISGTANALPKFNAGGNGLDESILTQGSDASGNYLVLGGGNAALRVDSGAAAGNSSEILFSRGGFSAAAINVDKIPDGGFLGSHGKVTLLGYSDSKNWQPFLTGEKGNISTPGNFESGGDVCENLGGTRKCLSQAGDITIGQLHILHVNSAQGSHEHIGNPSKSITQMNWQECFFETEDDGTGGSWPRTSVNGGSCHARLVDDPNGAYWNVLAACPVGSKVISGGGVYYLSHDSDKTRPNLGTSPSTMAGYSMGTTKGGRAYDTVLNVGATTEGWLISAQNSAKYDGFYISALCGS